jgi:hypothetical protein
MKKQFICLFVLVLALFSGCAEVPQPDYVGAGMNGSYNLQLEVVRSLGITHEGVIRVEAWASRNIMIKEINLELAADGCTQLKATDLIKVAKVTSQWLYW